jgi:proteasome lid subunit RPN8/RPN11
MTPQAWKVDALAHARRDFPRESCGLLVRLEGGRSYWPCRNLADNDETFLMDPADYAEAEDAGEVVAIIHSHPNASSRPSQADLVACEASGLPWHIVSVPDGIWSACAPTGYRAPLLEREFAYGILDCYTLIRDWYREERGIELPQVESRFGWWRRGENLYLETFPRIGFVEIPLAEIAPGDVILMRLRSSVVNHGAVYLGNDMILHHVLDRLSAREVYGGYWRKITAMAIRYKGGGA